MDCKEFKNWLTTRDDGAAERARQHRAACLNCHRLYTVDERLEQALWSGMRAASPTEGLARRARTIIDAEAAPTSAGWPTWVRKSLAPAFAMGLFFIFVVWNPFANPLSSLDAIGRFALANHTRSDLPMAFSAADTPDPQAWFLERLNYRITMPALHERGYVFLGGRECTIGPKKAAYLLYDDNGKRVSVFIVPAGEVKMDLQEERHYIIDAPRHRVDLWKAQGMVCILVQDRSAGIPLRNLSMAVPAPATAPWVSVSPESIAFGRCLTGPHHLKVAEAPAGGRNCGTPPAIKISV